MAKTTMTALKSFTRSELEPNAVSSTAVSSFETLTPPNKPAARTESPPAFKSRLICDDVINALSKQPSAHKFDVIIAAPPYNIGKTFGAIAAADYVACWRQ